jgi:uncharacterized protein GlcG (DUF336 family)
MPKDPSMSLTLKAAQALVASILEHARQKSLKPIVAVVLDDRGALKAAAAEDGTSLKRFEIAHGKAFGALALGMGSRAIDKRAQSQPTFVAAISHIVGGSLVPVPGGVLIVDQNRTLLGAAGVSGDTSDNDEAAILAAIEACGLIGDPG